jgi:PleD family two-component response regulator
MSAVQQAIGQRERALRRLFRWPSGTVSIGVAVLGQHGNDLFELLAAADVALYRANDAGRDQVRIYARAPGNAQENKDEATDACP